MARSLRCHPLQSGNGIALHFFSNMQIKSICLFYALDWIVNLPLQFIAVNLIEWNIKPVTTLAYILQRHCRNKY